MHFSPLLLGLAATTTVSAIDLRAHLNDGCQGYWVACTNIGPNECCRYSSGAGSDYASVSVVAIPTNWRIRGESYSGGGCLAPGGTEDSNGKTTICLPKQDRGRRTGAKYWFLNRKRAADESCPARQPGGGAKCEAEVEADTLGLGDGTEYNISGLSDDKIQEMEEIAKKGVDMPAEFQVLRRSI